MRLKLVLSLAVILSMSCQQNPSKVQDSTSDNVEVSLNSTVFYRVTDASRSVYRIKDIDSALKTAATSIVRSAAG